MCPNRLSTRPRQHMDVSVYQKVARELLDLGISTLESVIGLCGIGEPMLHPRFEEIIRWTHDLGLMYGVGTNGTMFGRYMPLFLECPPEEICFSMDGTTQEEYEVMRPGLSLAELEDSTRRYLTALRTAKHVPAKIWVQMIVGENNVGHVNDFIRRWLPYTDPVGGKVFIKCICPWPHYPVNDLYPSPVPDIDPDLVPRVGLAGFDPPIRFRDTCRLFDGFLQVLSNGDYTPCCSPTRDYWGIGNARDMSIMEAFNGPVMRRLRQTPKTEIPFCKDCI